MDKKLPMGVLITSVLIGIVLTPIILFLVLIVIPMPITLLVLVLVAVSKRKKG